MPSIHTSTKFGSLLAAIIAKIEGITTVNDAIVGTYDPVTFGQFDASYFPCAEILMSGWSGGEYTSQQNLESTFEFDVYAHTFASTVGRVDGTDMLVLDRFCTTIRTEIFGFNNDSVAPCTGFLFVEPAFSMSLHYGEFSENINTGIMKFSIRVDTVNTTA